VTVWISDQIKVLNRQSFVNIKGKVSNSIFPFFFLNKYISYSSSFSSLLSIKFINDVDVYPTQWKFQWFYGVSASYCNFLQSLLEKVLLSMTI